MYKSILCITREIKSGDTLDGLGTPVGAYITENLSSSGKQVAKHHGYTVQAIILRGQQIRLSDASPIK